MTTEFTITNNILTAKIKQLGAELCSLYNHQSQLEYMWSADPAFWGKSSPVLFPIVGALKNSQYIHNNKTYTLPRHGFARERVFTVEEHQPDRIVFLLTDDDASRLVYPFSFELRITYTLTNNELQVLYAVTNKGTETMLFSIGAHPAFKVPLTNNNQYTDYYLEFSNAETAPIWPINEAGLIRDTPTTFFTASQQLKLNKELFYNDALVFKNLRSNCIAIGSSKDQHKLEFLFDDFPFFGIWAAKNADFVCLEPWCGIADSVHHNQQLQDKEGIEKISANETWKRSWCVRTIF